MVVSVYRFTAVGVYSTALHEIASCNQSSSGDVYESVDYTSMGISTVRSANTTGTGVLAASGRDTSGAVGKMNFGVVALMRRARAWVA